jgi:hypothetical protein
MIVSKIEGGLGNQMFQYASARALSIKYGSPLKLDLTWFDKQHLHNGYELNKFNIKAEIASIDDIKLFGGNANNLIKAFKNRLGIHNSRYILEPNYHYYVGFESLSPPVYLHGYWQSYKYFDQYMEKIRSELTPVLELSKESQLIAQDLADVNSVSIHIRRGDYVSDKKINAVHGVLDLTYYFKAINFLVEKLKYPHFYIFSDDPLWVKENLNLKFPTSYISHNIGERSFEDMQLMRLCKHNIIANSSFSWWGAWLNEDDKKTVIAPANWFKNSKPTTDLLPANWITI